MNRFVLFSLGAIFIVLFTALGFIGGNLYAFAQTQTNLAANGYGMGGRMMGRMMDNRAGLMANCPCLDNSIQSQTVPATPATPNTNSTTSSSASSVAPGVLTKSGNAYVGQAGNLRITLTMTPAPAAFSATTFDITLTDEKGNAVSDANVSLDLTMPSMWMPANKPQAKALGDGKYQAIGRFTMRGGWRINVIIEQGGQKQNAYFDIVL